MMKERLIAPTSKKDFKVGMTVRWNNEDGFTSWSGSLTKGKDYKVVGIDYRDNPIVIGDNDRLRAPFFVARGHWRWLIVEQIEDKEETEMKLSDYVKAWEEDNDSVELKTFGGTWVTQGSNVFFSPDYEYRLAPKILDIDWSRVDTKYNYAIISCDDCIFTEKSPRKEGGVWIIGVQVAEGFTVRAALDFKILLSPPPKSDSTQHSLTKRPNI